MSNRQQRRLQQKSQSEPSREQTEKGSRVSRRLWLGVAGLAGIVSLTYGIREFVRAPTYEEALFDPSKRQAYAKSLLQNKPTYADIQYMPQELLAKLKEEGYELPFGAFASTVPHERDPLRIGTKSTIILTTECFDTVYQQVQPAWHDMGLIIQNIIQNHERRHADHFYRGITEYKQEEFMNGKKEFNDLLFIAVSELLAHQEEYRGLKRIVNEATTPFLNHYMSQMSLLMAPQYRELHNPEVICDMDPAFIKRLQQELAPQLLLK